MTSFEITIFFLSTRACNLVTSSERLTEAVFQNCLIHETYICGFTYQVGDLSTHTTRFISPALTQKVFANIRRVRKGFSGVETPLFEGMLAARQLAEEGIAEEQVQADVAVVAAVQENVAEDGRMIDDLDKDKGIELVVDQVKDVGIAKTEGRHAAEQAEIYHLDLDHPSKVLSMQEDDSEVQEVVEVVTTTKLIIDVVTAASQVSAARVIIKDPEEELSLKTFAETPKLKDKGKGILIETPKPMKKQDQIELDAEYARKLHEEINKDHEEINKDIDWDDKIDHTESEARKNMMIYLKNTAGYKMDFFKGMSYDEICLIFQARFDANMRFLFKSREEMEEEDQKVLKSINETPAHKAVKKRKLNEEAQEAEDLKKRLEVVDDEDDDRSRKNTMCVNAADEELTAAVLEGPAALKLLVLFIKLCPAVETEELAALTPLLLLLSCHLVSLFEHHCLRNECQETQTSEYVSLEKLNKNVIGLRITTSYQSKSM
nr:hypothetical protein [Tanacetum cinerariifolium]